MTKPLDQPSFTPIGVIHTPFKERRTAPRQATSTDGLRGEGMITLNPGLNFEHALEDLAGFERIWIIAWLHQNKDWKPKVLPPRGGNKRRGVFATRSPHRPNPIGLSCARLLEIKDCTLRVAEIDLLDGTPILDLKPYISYADSFPQARAGWLEEARQNHSGHPRCAVEWSTLAREQAEWLQRVHAVYLIETVEGVLGMDPEPHRYRRIKNLEATGRHRRLAVQSWRIFFEVCAQDLVRIERITSGYGKEALAGGKSDRPMHQPEAHRDFHRNWG